jgi:hypothetical protein
MKVGKYTLEYEVYFKDSGKKTSSQIFIPEDQACNYLFKRIKDNWAFEQMINNIH